VYKRQEARFFKVPDFFFGFATSWKNF
jgi:hypothetical protein